MIASEKSGIMKAGVPCVIGYQTDEAVETGVLKTFHNISTGLSPSAEIFRYGAQWDIEPQNDCLIFTWQGESIATSHINLKGPHQIYNAGAAIAAYRIIMVQDFDAKTLSPDNPENPLCTVHWPGRLQKISDDAYQNIGLAMVHDTQELWLDGGHNDSAGIMLAEQAKQWQEQDNKPLHLIIAMVNRKNPAEFLTPLVPYVDSITVTSIPDEASSYNTDELFDLVTPLGFKNVNKAQTAQKALAEIKGPNARILMTGSLYFVGALLK